jgi:hypothetical protein
MKGVMNARALKILRATKLLPLLLLLVLPAVAQAQYYYTNGLDIWTYTPSGAGTMFAIKTDGTGFTNLYSFTVNPSGANPQGRLILSGNTLYGTASDANYTQSSGYLGTVFAFILPAPPPIAITTIGNQIILSWPTNATRNALQSVNNLSSGTWSNVTSGITIVGTNYVFTASSISGNAAFFRLEQ